MRQRADLASTLLASISHDLRTPLTAIRVAVEQPAGPRRCPTRSARRRRGSPQVELDRLTRLFRDILDMARIDAAAIELEHDWVTPSDIIDAAIGPRPAARSTGARCAIDADDAPRSASSRASRRRRSSHLLENAAQYSPRRPPDRGRRARVGPDGLHLDGHRSRARARSQASWITCSSASTAASTRGDGARHRHGPRDHARPAGRRRRAGLGRERRGGGARFTIVVPAARSAPRRRGD